MDSLTFCMGLISPSFHLFDIGLWHFRVSYLDNIVFDATSFEGAARLLSVQRLKDAPTPPSL